MRRHGGVYGGGMAHSGQRLWRLSQPLYCSLGALQTHTHTAQTGAAFPFFLWVGAQSALSPSFTYFPCNIRMAISPYRGLIVFAVFSGTDLDVKKKNVSLESFWV